MSEMSNETVPTNAGPDAVSGLDHKPLWDGDKVAASEGEDITFRGSDNESDGEDKPRKTAAKKAEPKKS